MTCVCECHAQKRASAANQSNSTTLPKATPTTNDSNQTPSLACAVSVVNQPVPPTGTLGLVQPTELQPHTTATLGSISSQSVGRTTNVLAIGNPPTLLLPSMLLSAGGSNSTLQKDSQSKSTSVKFVANPSSISHEAKKLGVATAVSEDSKLEAEKVNAICCSEVQNCPKGKPSDTVEKIEASGLCINACSDAQSSKCRKVCESEGVAAEPTGVLVKEDGEKNGKTEKEKEVLVLDDDFKPPKKRFRTPAATSSDGPVSSLYNVSYCTYM